jgi:hypothetical protein
LIIMLTLFRPGCKTAKGMESMPCNAWGSREIGWKTTNPSRGGTSAQKITFRLPEAGHDSFPFCNAPLVKLCANLRARTPKFLEMEPLI